MTARYLTPTDVTRLLGEHGLAPRKAAGQNFVIDANTIDRIVEAADLRPDDVVVEIGPGLGSLTAALIDVVRRVVAIEIDAGFVEVLRERLGDLEGLEILHADAMEVDYRDVLAGESGRLVANLPYNLATPMVMEAMLSPVIDDAFVMVQREVGERWVAEPGDPQYGAVSVKLALLANAELAFSVPRTVFLPQPNVDSVMVRIRRRPDAPDLQRATEIHGVVDAAFAQRRKTLRNSLQVMAERDEVDAALDAAGIDPDRRAETLDLEEFRRLARAFGAGPGGAG